MPRTRLRPTDGCYGPAWTARFLGIARTTLHAWVKRGVLVPTKYAKTKIGPAMRFHIDYLREFRETRMEYGGEAEEQV